MTEKPVKSITVTVADNAIPGSDEPPDMRVVVRIEGITDVDLSAIRRIVESSRFTKYPQAVGEKKGDKEEYHVHDFAILLKPTDKPEEFIYKLGQHIPNITNRASASEEARKLSQSLQAGARISPPRL